MSRQETRKKGGQESAIDLDNAGAVEKKPEENTTFKKYQQFFHQNAEFEDVGPLRLIHDEKVKAFESRF